MNIFDFIDDILYTKKNRYDNDDINSDYSPFITNRWLSMHSPEMAQCINETSNTFYSLFDTSQQHYNFLRSILPKVNRKRINYIKKVKKENKDEDINIPLIAKELELSEREVKYLLDSSYES